MKTKLHHAQRLAGLVTIMLAGLSAGCASSYLTDRGRDAADIFTATLGAGSGAKLRLGPVQLAVIENTDIIGLRAGQGFLDGTDYINNAEAYSFIPLTRRSDWSDPVARRVFHRPSKEKAADFRAPEDYVHTPPPVTDWSSAFGREVFSHGPESPSSQRGKDIDAVSPYPPLSVGRPAALKTQIEVAVGLIFTVRLGFNPGELVDFLLGWTTLDIHDDDRGLIYGPYSIR